MPSFSILMLRHGPEYRYSPSSAAFLRQHIIFVLMLTAHLETRRFAFQHSNGLLTDTVLDWTTSHQRFELSDPIEGQSYLLRMWRILSAIHTVRHRCDKRLLGFELFTTVERPNMVWAFTKSLIGDHQHKCLKDPYV